MSLRFQDVDELRLCYASKPCREKKYRIAKKKYEFEGTVPIKLDVVRSALSMLVENI